MGTSDAKKQEKERKAQIAKERTGETSTAEDLETQDIKVRPPVYANGYPVEHVAPFPPTVPGKPVPFLPAVPFTGKVVSGTPVVERPALMPQGSIKAMAAQCSNREQTFRRAFYLGWLRLVIKGVSVKTSRAG